MNGPDVRISDLLGAAVDGRSVDVDGRLRSVLDHPPRKPNHRLAIAVAALVVAAAGVALAVWAFRGHAPTRPARPVPPGLIAVARGQPDQPDATDIYLMRANGRIVRRLTRFSDVRGSARFSDLRGSARAPAWSPDGRRVLFVLDRDGRDDLYVMDVDGKNLHRLTHILGVSSAAWSPDGRLIAISVRGSGVDVLRPDGTGLHEILPLPRCPGVGPVSWTPDGRVLATYQCMVGRAQIPSPPISIVSVRGGKSHLFLERFSRAAWSPDGSQVALEGHDGQIWTMRADRTGLHRLTPCSEGEKCSSYANPTWSPDGQEIAFARLGDVSQIYAINADGTHLRAVTSGPLSAASPAWQPAAISPSPSPSPPRTNGGQRILPPPSGPQVQAVVRVSSFSGGLAMTESGGRVWVLGSGGGGWLGVVDPTSNKMVTYTTFQGSVSSTHLSIAPDEQGGVWFALGDGIFHVHANGKMGPSVSVPGVRAVAAGEGRVWALTERSVVPIDPAAGRPLARFPVHCGCPLTSIVVAAGSVWVGDEGKDAVERVDPVSGRVIATVRLLHGSGPPTVVAAGGDVLVLDDPGVYRIDPPTNRAHFTDSVAAFQLRRVMVATVGDGFIWAKAQDYPSEVYRIDPATGLVAGVPIDVFHVPQSSCGIAAAGHSLWQGCVGFQPGPDGGVLDPRFIVRIREPSG